MIKVKKFIKDSYTFSPLAFWCEMVEAILLITASAILTFTILDPATKLFIPMYFFGSALGVVSAVIRKAAFVILLCGWFTIMNAIALLQLFIL
jgi:hypothetical protein